MKLCTMTLLLGACGALSAQTEEVKRKFYADIQAALALRAGAVVADVGSGDELDHDLVLANAVGESGRVVCVDINQGVLDKLKGNLPPGTRNIEVHLGKPEDPLLPASTFDALLISNAYHEMTSHHAMLLHLRDTLKPDGRLVVIEAIDNQRRQATREEQAAHHELSPDRVESELAAAGFQVIDRVEPLVVRGDGVVRYLIAATKAATVPTDPWISLRWIEGTWEGPSAGEPGKGISSRECRFALKDRFLNARNKSVWQPKPPSANPEVHEDFGTFSYDRARKTIILRQFHVEGFVNEYALRSVSADGKTVEFVTERIENIAPGWKAKEVYRIVSPDDFIETFYLAAPGKDFEVYSESHLKRVK